MFNEEWAQETLSTTPKSVCNIAYDVVAKEGGFSDNPHDAGGVTNYGISIVTARSYGTQFDYDGDGIVTASDMKLITPSIAAAFYVQEYFYKPRINLLPECLYPVTLDMSVNMGSNAVKIIQHAAIILGGKITPDGIIGPTTAACCQKLTQADNGKSLINLICSLREIFYRQLVASRPSNKVFLTGWLNRAASFSVA